MKVLKFVFLDTYMSLAHDGLSKIIQNEKKKSSFFRKQAEDKNSLFLFINRAKTKCKIFNNAGTVIGYLRPKSGQISQVNIHEIAIAFGGSYTLARQVENAIKQASRESEIAS